MAEIIVVNVTEEVEAVAKARAAQAAAEEALEQMTEFIGSPIIREMAGTYEDRPSTDTFPNVTWFGQTDPTSQPTFVPYNPETGVGDMWIEVNL